MDKNQQSNDVLHYGVKGMHWGVRKELNRQARTVRRNAKELRKLGYHEEADIADRVAAALTQKVSATNKETVANGKSFLSSPEGLGFMTGVAIGGAGLFIANLMGK